MITPGLRDLTTAQFMRLKMIRWYGRRICIISDEPQQCCTSYTYHVLSSYHGGFHRSKPAERLIG